VLWRTQKPVFSELHLEAGRDDSVRIECTQLQCKCCYQNAPFFLKKHSIAELVLYGSVFGYSKVTCALRFGTLCTGVVRSLLPPVLHTFWPCS
jgi:hypothetical protein